jgi:hypothetical protein
MKRFDEWTWEADLKERAHFCAKQGGTAEAYKLLSRQRKHAGRELF